MVVQKREFENQVFQKKQKFDQMEKIHESGCILTDCWKIFLADYVFPRIKIPGKIIY